MNKARQHSFLVWVTKHLRPWESGPGIRSSLWHCQEAMDPSQTTVGEATSFISYRTLVEGNEPTNTKRH